LPAPPWFNHKFLRKKAKQHRIARAERHITADLDKRAALRAEMDKLVRNAVKAKV
jgi:hypothetical protein